MFLWTRSYKNSQPRRNFSGKGRTTLQQRPKVIKWYFFLKKLLDSSKCSCGQVECSFDNPIDTFQEKGVIFFPSNSKNDGN